MLVIDLFYCSLLFFIVLAETERMYELTIERAKIVMIDTEFIDIEKLKITRINRTHTVINGNGSCKVEVDNSVLVTMLFYEKSGGTDYKRSAAVSYKNKPVCDFFNTEALGIKDLKASSNFPEKCPVKPGFYEVKNYILHAENFPAYIPGSFWRTDIFLMKDDIQWSHVQVFVKIDQKLETLG